ncbi:1,3-beta-galactosyl-N-acetylhexosamine phosphorylase [Anaerocolumna cellulosilytica]|uniref:1,3-beta-galactosyl-N-acetylhexosamine phosphorylase n=1 Tax=Anaerocolumna cellulosilytica TaxID=433286 RepID=A0A6S6R519_9FIRM|nr:1,3-beta-galactosyl-N-acetylhexosamine phosphorylase [Anaerocolumna cellulosilytica]MBB5197796.1 beta-D-galactosyl-(1->4)-L-rhamnose phosphorylase [Anaerocolumna cellulosilytica]BCJ96439.1 1,3-beta-galactosyl-N-acetylhexosamine phosphorylase [Anaerocolumna cellulosilytica]
MTNEKKTGSFTLPGESGYEELTLKLAKKWGADVIRDSDGTVLSDEIISAGYGIYSTICIIRDHNQWAAQNTDKLQQSFLMTNPVVAKGNELEIPLMNDFFEEQFTINDSEDSIKYWQVYDRTTNKEVSRDKWSYNQETTSVLLKEITPWHKYTVSFMAYRIWEEISMYNHTTNNWDKEHLMQIDPMHVETQEYLLNWLDNWCQTHKETTVVRFTSMFYNFVWIWGSNERNRHLFSDWGSYDFTVSPLALDKFKEKYGYALTAEDFINQGKLQVTHMPGSKEKADWMEFINDFVIDFGKKLIQMVHDYGKSAYVFYDDSWVGIEPYNGKFEEFGFDGLIKCVFSGYEVRLCSGAPVDTHELRLHPYLFPVGLGGAPTFMEGGDPTLEAKNFWISIRRALLRAPIDRIGLGGYLHLTEPFPEFNDYIEKVADEFRLIKELHHNGSPYCFKPRIAVLHTWGKLRSWTLSGHFHETHMHDLIHINEVLSGLPFEVSFINFDDVKAGALDTIDIVINAGYAGSAWSGGASWSDTEVLEKLTQWVNEGGTFMGINEPSALEGYDNFFRMSHVLGIDKDTGAKVCHGKWSFNVEGDSTLLPENYSIKPQKNLYLTDGLAKVLAASADAPVLTAYEFGKGKGIYLASYEITPENSRMLLNLLVHSGREEFDGKYLTDNLHTECAYYPNTKTLVVINNSDQAQTTTIKTDFGSVTVTMEAFDNAILPLDK